MTDTEDTLFAPARRRPQDEIERHWESLASTPLLGPVMDTVADGMLVLNECRQIVYANQAFASIVGCSQARRLAGLRPGEALGCIHATEHVGGCGTSEFCQKCGAARAILACQEGTADAQECSVSLASGESLEVRVHATPLEVGGVTLAMIYITDLSNEKRRRVLERIFFHDVLNTAGGLQGIADIVSRSMSRDTDQSRLASAICTLSRSIIEEIEAQKDLTAAETQELTVHPSRLQAREVLEEVAEAYRHHEVARDKAIVVDPTSVSREFIGDRVILRRVLGNLLKNALEASRSGAWVTLACAGGEDGGVVFEVHNQTFMPRDVQLQVFQRSFSTRGPGRGVGTYSIKLLTEKYLRGKVTYATHEAQGTTFQVSLPAGIPSVAASGGAGSPPASEPEPAPATLQGARIVLAEDNWINQRIALKLLTSLGAEVEIVSNGREALDRVMGGPVPPSCDLLLLDLHMPDMDGWEAAAVIRSDPRFASLPIIAMTADDSEEEVAHCLSVGMNAHISKPYERAVILETLGRFYRVSAGTVNEAGQTWC